MSRFSRADVALLVMRLGYATLLFGFHGWSRVIKAWNFWLAGRTGPDYIMWRGGGPTAAPYPTIHEPKV